MHAPATLPTHPSLPPLPVLAELATRTLIEPATFARSLDEMTTEQRVAAMMACGGTRLQASIWKAVAGAPRMRIDHMVPPEIPPLRPVIFHLKNSLAMFTESQKRFCRSPDGKELWGYNHQAMSWITGPGYFVATDTDHELGGVVLDYRRTPPPSPLPVEGWPKVHRNERIPDTLVWGGMTDYMRRVSRHVCIGAAVRGGAFADMYFMLCREF